MGDAAHLALSDQMSQAIRTVVRMVRGGDGGSAGLRPGDLIPESAAATLLDGLEHACHCGHCEASRILWAVMVVLDEFGLVKDFNQEGDPI